MISELFHIILYQPLFNALVFLYNTVAGEDLGIAIILLTLAIRVILFPLFHKGARHQAAIQQIQPELKKIQKEYKDDRAAQTEKIMELYKEHNVNPFSSILFLIIQIPVLLALYRIFLQGLTPESMDALYSFVNRPDVINHSFLGLIDLGKQSIVIVGIAAAAQYVQGWLALRVRKTRPGNKDKTASQAEKIGKSMVFIAPLITLLIFYHLPSAVALYWLVTSLFSIVQQVIVNRSVHNNGTDRTVEKSNTHTT